MNRAQRRTSVGLSRKDARLKAKVEAHIAEKLGGTDGVAFLETFLTDLFGVGSWTHDPVENLWVTPDPKYQGPGHAYVCFRRDGSWFQSVLPDAAMS